MTFKGQFTTLVLVASAICGCRGQSPATPTAPTSTLPVASAPIPTTQLESLRVVGRVVDGTDNPIPNARLTSWLDSKDTTISDASGAFDFIMSVKAQDRTFWLTVEKAGYETSELSRNVVDAATTVLRLHRIQSIEAGNSLRAFINPDDSACGYHWGYICRRVRVTSPSSGRLTLELVSDGTGLGMPMGPAGFPQSLERRMSTSVKPGVEVSVDIAASWPLDVSTAFTLNTFLTSEN